MQPPAEFWHKLLPVPDASSHKYSRGFTLVAGGGVAATGAARMAARAALRVGSGLVAIACDSDALPVYAIAMEAVMLRRVDEVAAWKKLLEDERITAYLVGPGCGVDQWTLDRGVAALESQKPLVLDADALTVFAKEPPQLFSYLDEKHPCILTPHEGEFARLFSSLVDAKTPKTEQTKQAARLSDAVVVYKGSETVVAAPDGRVHVSKAAPPWLATAGTGDVLAGLCAGLLAQGMPAYEAACAAIWMHGAAAHQLGAGLIAEDLPDTLPTVLKSLYETHR